MGLKTGIRMIFRHSDQESITQKQNFGLIAKRSEKEVSE